MGFDWRGMDTAPKDGTWMLAMNNRGNCAVIIWSERAFDRSQVVPGWIHPFSTGELSPFWNGGCGSVPIAWAPLPTGEAARAIVEAFTKRAA